MSLHAVGDIDDAIDAMKAFLLPFEFGRWLRLALIVFFIGGGGSVSGFQNLGNLSDIGSNGGPGGAGSGVASLTAPLESGFTLSDGLLQLSGPSQVPPGVSDALAGVGIAVIALGVVVLLLIALVFAVLGATMEFVFAKSLISTDVHVRRSLRTHLGDGLRLLVFRFVVGLLALLVFGGLLVGAVILMAGGAMTDIGPSVVLGSLGLFIFVLVAAAVVVGTITGFTNVFVVPLMIQGDHGVLAGWGRLWTSITAEPKQYLVYLFMSVVLSIGVSIIGSVLGAIAVVVLLIPFGIAGAALWFALGAGGTAAVVAVGIVAVLFVVALLVVANLIKVPLQTFLRYYAMLVLGDIDAALDPIPDVRESIRS